MDWAFLCLESWCNHICILSELKIHADKDHGISYKKGFFFSSMKTFQETVPLQPSLNFDVHFAVNKNVTWSCLFWTFMERSTIVLPKVILKISIMENPHNGRFTQQWHLTVKWLHIVKGALTYSWLIFITVLLTYR